MSQNDQDDERQRLFARNLRAAREQAGHTQATMATKLGMEDEVYARYERAKMWPSLDRLGRICDILGCTSDSLLGTDQPPPQPARTTTQTPDDDSPDVRRLLRRLRKARPKTLRLVKQMLDEFDEHARPSPGDERSRAAPGEDDAAAADAAPRGDAAAASAVPGDAAVAGASSSNDVTAAAGPSSDDGGSGGTPGDDGSTGEP